LPVVVRFSKEKTIEAVEFYFGGGHLSESILEVTVLAVLFGRLSATQYPPPPRIIQGPEALEGWEKASELSTQSYSVSVQVQWKPCCRRCIRDD
jgi:hypothetical protein